MSDSVKKWHEMRDEQRLEIIENSDARNFLWILDFEMGRVFMYNIRRADLETEDYEDIEHVDHATKLYQGSNQC